MDNSKLESNVKYGEWVVVRYIFHIMYGRKCLMQWMMKVFDLMDESDF
jgi:hypothetical protein